MTARTAVPPPLLTGLDLEPVYEGASALTAFYVPVLQRATRYDRTAGYFRASSLAAAAQGVARFIANGGTMRLVCGAALQPADCDALLGDAEVPGDLAARLLAGLATSDEIARHRIQVLAWLVRVGRLEVRLAVELGRDGRPLTPEQSGGYFHEKLGIFYDAEGNVVAMHGSNNESRVAWLDNFESFSASSSWEERKRTLRLAALFEERWQSRIERYAVVPLPAAVQAGLVDLAPDEPPERDFAEPAPPANRPSLAAFLARAPRLPNGEATLEATTGVTLFPHQRKVVDRLAGQYPRSWLVADEVGLGKTISAGMALRRLVLSAQAERVLILAPANVCRQWQDELFEKFALWVPRLEGREVHGAHPDDVRSLLPGENPYETEPVLLVSSHLARRREHQRLILAAEPYDLLIVDEAHHARRRGSDPDDYRPSRLLELLDAVSENRHARAVWLLTATPMQVHPVELFDLLRHVGLGQDPQRGYPAFRAFFGQLGRPAEKATNWTSLARYLGQLPGDVDPADRAVLEQIGDKVGAYAKSRIGAFGRGDGDPRALAEELGADARRELRAWVRQRGPVGRLVTRHTRETLKRYRAQGLLHEPIAERETTVVPIDFTPEEGELYSELDDLIGRLMEAHGTRRGAGFVLTTYRRRLTSSWEAIRQSFARRVAEESPRLELDEDLELLGELEDADEELGADSVDESAAVPLTADEVAQMADYLQRLERVREEDSKYEQLRRDVNDARAAREGLIVFTQFTTTMRYLRDRLQPAYREELATFSGGGGQLWREGEWRSCSKQDLVEALQARQVTVVVCTDAASEGLNMQACSRLVNFDLPWNPMRVEQRIGRIDRIGQVAPVVRVRSYTIPGTVEDSVYAALLARIDSFADLVGRLQPILGATEGALRSVYRRPRAERDAATQSAVGNLERQIEELDAGGIDFSDEDPLPLVPLPPPALDARALGRTVTEELGLALDSPGAPVTLDPRRASRDAEDWRALVTFGHPQLRPALQAVELEGARPRALVLAEDEACAAAVRADRVPPQSVTAVGELAGLGEPVALGDAEERAAQIARSVVEGRALRATEVERARHESGALAILRDFRRAVRDGLRAEVTLRRNRGHDISDTGLVWSTLVGSNRRGWKHADRFRQLLGIELPSLVGTTPLSNDDRPVNLLSSVVDDAGTRIDELAREWAAAQRA